MSKQTTDYDWLSLLRQFPEANFLQSPAYAEMNERLGFKVITKMFGKNAGALMVVRDAKRGRYLEIPCGPLLNWQDQKLAKRVLEEIRKIAIQEKCVFVRLRPQLKQSEKHLETMAKLGLVKSPMHLAAEHTVMIDLSLTEEELLAKMRRQTRYEVRKAEKLGIRVTKDNSEEIFRDFHQIQAETAKRQGFIPPSLETLLAERVAFRDQIWIYTAMAPTDAGGTDAERTDTESAAKPIAYGIIIKDGKEGDYYEAASTELNRKLPGAYALLWQAMKDLKREGCERFNLWGIAPPGQTNHRYSGVTTFKTGFGGEVIEYVPAHDMVISKPRYLKNLLVETARKKRRRL